jgi:hypothetical protein
MQITITCVDSGGGHACGLALGLKKYGDVTAVWQNRNKHGLDYLVPDARFGFHKIPTYGDHLIIVSCITFDRLLTFDRLQLRDFRYDHRHVIVTDGRFARNPNLYNYLFRSWDVLTTGCKRHFREPYPVKTYYQPFDLEHISRDKETLIGHSPFGPIKQREKGTEEIIEATKDYDFDLITGVSWDECLERKAKCHIFVDQIDHYDRDKFQFKNKDYVWPALGKSGIEAMHLGCLVITHGKSYDTEIPAPPVAWCNGNFKEVLNYYINHESERKELAAAGREWALKYASYDFAAQNVLK